MVERVRSHTGEKTSCAFRCVRRFQHNTVRRRNQTGMVRDGDRMKIEDINFSEQKGFVFLRSYYEAIRPLKSRDRLAMYDAIMLYGMTGAITELEGINKSLFDLIQPTIDSGIARYVRNRENGKKGGRPVKTESNPKTNPDETEPKPKA